MQSPTQSEQLHPWPVILSVLVEIPSSDEFLRVISRTGVEINFQLDAGDYSHGTRLREYMKRVQHAVSLLGQEDKLRVAAIVSGELAKKEKLSEKLQHSLGLIGWIIKDGILTTTNGDVINVFFPKGAVHDAYIEIRQLLLSSQTSIEIVDPYSDSTIFQMLSASSVAQLKIRILTAKTPPDLAAEAKKFKQQHTGFDVSIRTSGDFHDRFIVRDGKDCFHLGHSIKDFGSKARMLSQIFDDSNCTALKTQIEQSWNSAAAFQF